MEVVWVRACACVHVSVYMCILFCLYIQYNNENTKYSTIFYLISVQFINGDWWLQGKFPEIWRKKIWNFLPKSSPTTPSRYRGRGRERVLPLHNTERNERTEAGKRKMPLLLTRNRRVKSEHFHCRCIWCGVWMQLFCGARMQLFWQVAPMELLRRVVCERVFFFFIFCVSCKTRLVQWMASVLFVARDSEVTIYTNRWRW